MTRNRRLVMGMILFLAMGAEADTRQRVEADLETLTSLGSRVVGYPGHTAAADFIERRFRELGLSVERDSFTVVVPIDLGASVTLTESGEQIPLRCLWPNQVRTSTIAEPGLQAPLFYAGDATLAQVKGQPLSGRVALVEFNTQLRWLQLAALGVRAFIFIEPESTTHYEAARKFAVSPIDVPRFWIDRPAGLALRRRLLAGEQTDVILRGRMDWEARTAWNLVASIPTPAGVDSGAGTVYVHAHYDGTSIVPGLDPGMQSAASVVGLLETARHLAANPPRRTVRLLALSAHYQEHQGIQAVLAQRPLPDLFLGLDLSTGSDQLGLWNNTDKYDLKRLFLPFSKLAMGHGQAVALGLGRDPDEALINGITPLRGHDWYSYTPTPISTDAFFGLLAPRPALTLATVHDARPLLFTPLDTLTVRGIDHLTQQIEVAREMLRRSLDDPSLLDGSKALIKALKPELSAVRVRVRGFMRRSGGPDRRIAGATVLLPAHAKQKGGVVGQRVYLADQDGNVIIDPVPYGYWPITAYSIEPESGRIVRALDMSTRAKRYHGTALPTGYVELHTRLKSQEKALVLFSTVPRDLHALIAPRSLQTLLGVRVVDAMGATPHEYGVALSRFEEEPSGVIFGPVGIRKRDRLKLIFGGHGGSLLVTNASGHSTQGEARGTGFLLQDTDWGDVTLQATKDMWSLDEFRLARLRRHAIGNRWLEGLHDRVGDLIEEAETAREDFDWERHVALAREALGLESRAYPRVLGTLNDVIGGMVFILALLLPAVFFAERLFIAATDIRRQLAGFGGILLVIWLILSQVHPAFELAQPIVVFLGFAIMAISVFVLSMISARFTRARQEFESRISQIHVVDISRSGAAFAAFMLGISNMRRRQLRTALTLVTLSLLTFTVMSFTSFQPQTQ
ncbi:MAG: M28 family peptidase, partial [Gemmatimonadetes bacterium]|nr:M28 family peptidase [Gemmatimonadota bacterium]